MRIVFKSNWVNSSFRKAIKLKTMIQEINNIQDVETFIKQIASEIKDFHPMLDFSQYIDPETNQPRYTKEESAVRQELLDCCFDICATQTDDFFTSLLQLFQQSGE
jgi:hypothetical protein